MEQVWPRFSLARFDGAVCFAKTGFCASFMCDHIPPSARNWPCRLDERAHIRTFVLFYRIGCDPAQVDRGRKERFYYWVGWDVPVSGGFRLRISARGMLSTAGVTIYPGYRDLLSWESLMPAGAGTPRYENWMHWLVGGFRRLATTLPSWIPAFAGMTIGGPLIDGDAANGRMRSTAGAVYPGSESGTCFRTNRSCRLAPAHQGMKIGCIGWWKGSGVVCATHPTPSWGQAPALHSSFDPGLSLLGDGGWCRRPAPGFNHPGSESGTCFRTNRSCRLAPAHQGMKLDALVGGRVQASSVPRTPPLAGDKPQATSSMTIGLAVDKVTPVGMSPAGADQFIHPGSESGTCFRTNRSCRRVPAHQGMQIGCIG